VSPFQFVLAVLCAWRQREREDVIAFLREENGVLKVRLEGERLRLEDHERRRLAALGHRLGRRLLCRVATLVSCRLQDARNRRPAHECGGRVWHPACTFACC
jgi:hypothetical protein